jgi:hypothetical protein
MATIFRDMAGAAASEEAMAAVAVAKGEAARTWAAASA